MKGHCFRNCDEDSYGGGRGGSVKYVTHVEKTLLQRLGEGKGLPLERRHGDGYLVALNHVSETQTITYHCIRSQTSSVRHGEPRFHYLERDYRYQDRIQTW